MSLAAAFFFPELQRVASRVERCDAGHCLRSGSKQASPAAGAFGIIPLVNLGRLVQ